jgi:NTP pyrophosphatase (non-canonical NTP hydrolase)
MEIDKTILQKAVDTWGRDSQISMFIGEVGELLSLFGRDVQGRASKKDWVSELADVYIMLAQMIKMEGESLVQKAIDYKMHRLEIKLAEHTNPHPTKS